MRLNTAASTHPSTSSINVANNSSLNSNASRNGSAGHQPHTRSSTSHGPSGEQLLERTVLLIVNLRRLGVHRRVSNSQVEVDADRETILVHKRLLDAPQLQAIAAQHSAIRGYVNNHCLPSYFRKGVALLPIAAVEEVDAKLTEFHARREDLVDAFVDVYPDLVRTAQSRLRGLFDPHDYPAPEAVRAAFGFTWNYASLGVPPTLAAIDRDIFRREREKFAAQMDEAARSIQMLLRTNMCEMVRHMQERLAPGADGQPKAFRASSVNNLTEFLQTFDARNITDDAELGAVVTRARELLQGIDPQTLRRSDDVRETLRSGFTEMQRQLDRMVTNRPARRIVLERPPQNVAPQENLPQSISPQEVPAAGVSVAGVETSIPIPEMAGSVESSEEDGGAGSEGNNGTDGSANRPTARPIMGRDAPDGRILLAVKTSPEYRLFCAARQRAALPWLTADHGAAFEAAYQAAAGSLAGLDEFTLVDFAEAARLIESGELRWTSVS